jgi:hypothetical protein
MRGVTRIISPTPLRAPLDGGAAAANLPVWDLSDLYKAPDAPALARQWQSQGLAHTLAAALTAIANSL